MLQALRKHPFPVTAHFDYSLVLTYAFRPRELEPLIPPPLALDCYNKEWAFLAVAMVKTRKLRPTGFPAFLGSDFFLAGYRVFVRYNAESGHSLRGLYILRSETDKLRMQLLGNLFTHYNYSRIEIRQRMSPNGEICVESGTTGLFVTAQLPGNLSIPLPAHSPFPDWRTARRFAGPMPFTFTVDQGKKEVVIVEGVRSNWKPEPVAVLRATVPCLQDFSPATPLLANAFVIRNVPYAWKKGRIEKISN